jgi:hypothetical protein
MLGIIASPARRWNPHRTEERRMSDHGPNAKRAPRGSSLHRRHSENKCRQSAGERRILELIYQGAPLRGVLNEVCTAMDFQIGHVVSLILLTETEGDHHHSIAQCAMRFGQNVHSSTPILSRDKCLLGTLQIYCCDPRRPTPHENQMIERVIRLAAVALQHHEDTGRFARSSRHLRGEIGGSTPGRPPLIN